MKLSCNVIKDLLPSYIDTICSDDTKVLVEQHLKGCKECKKTLECMKNDELPVENQDKLQIDHMKKIRMHYSFISMGCYILLIFLLVMILSITFSNHYIFSNYFFMILSPVMMAASFLVSGKERKFTKEKIWTYGIAVLLLIYEIILMRMTFIWVTGEHLPFGIKLSELGPFIKTQLLVIMIAELVLLIYTILIGNLKNTDNFLCSAIAITGAVLSLAFITLLMRLTSFDNYVSFVWQMCSELLAELLIAVVCYKVYLQITKKNH